MSANLEDKTPRPLNLRGQLKLLRSKGPESLTRSKRSKGSSIASEWPSRSASLNEKKI
jgi:hypothetical protein